MLMLFRLGLLCLLSFNLYAKNCSNKKYIDFNGTIWKLKAYHKYFLHKITQECEEEWTTILYFQGKKNKFFIDGHISSIQSQEKRLLIKTFTGAHSGKLYTFILNKQGRVLLVPIIENNKKQKYFFSDLGERIETYYTLVKFGNAKEYFVFKVDQYELINHKINKISYFFNPKRKIYQQWKYINTLYQ